MITIKSSVITADIDETGAQLTRLASKSTEYLWNGNPEIWKKHAPVLFPFAGRLLDEKFIYRGREYGPVPIHGFAPYARYIPENVTENSVRMRMVVSDDIRAIWPFDFEFSVLFVSEDQTLHITYIVKNCGKETMIYGIGSHPGFNVPLTEGLEFEDYYIEFPYSGKVMRNLMSDIYLNAEKQVPFTGLDGNRLKLRHNLFDNDAVILSDTGNTAVIASDKDSKKITVHYPDTRYCALWHKVKMNVPFVCIEPWTSLPGFTDKVTDLEQKDDYNRLESGKTKEHHLDITITE